MENGEKNPFDVIVVGAGIAALAAANRLVAEGKTVVLLEKSRGVGGRMATRRLSGDSFDHGAQFFTTKGEDSFRQLCREWLFSGVIKPWFGRLGQMRYCGIKSMNSVAKELAADLDIRTQSLVTKLDSGRGVVVATCENGERLVGKKLILTAPGPQSLELLQRSNLDVEKSLLESLSTVSYEPCIALLVRLEEPSGMIAPGILKLENDAVFMTIADSHLKGTSRKPGIVALSSHVWAAENYERSREDLESELLEALEERIDIEPVETYLHKWKFAHRNGGVGEKRFAQSNTLPIWLAGDSFGEAKVQGAFLSGVEAAESVLNS